jgi:hypothetical protein
MKCLFLLLSSLSLLIAVTGCSGGAASTSGNGSGGVSIPTATLTGIAPSSAKAGAASLQLIAFGKNFGDSPSLQWNGTSLTTVCADQNLSPVSCAAASELSASIPASSLAKAGTARITVGSGGTSGSTSNALTFNILTPGSSPPARVRAVSGITSPNDIVWDAARRRLYVSVSSSDPANPNALAVIDPIAGSTSKTIPASSNPSALSLSSDDNYLWVGLDGSSSVERLLLPGMTRDLSFALPLDHTYPQQAVTIQAARLNPRTAAIIAGHSGGGNGVYIYDDSTPRPKSVPGFGASGGPMLDWVQWGRDDSLLYGNQLTTIDAGGIATLPVDTTGVTFNGYSGGLALQPSVTQFERSNGLLYSFGGAYDPTKPTLVGSFGLPITGAEACTDDVSLNRYYCLTTMSVASTDVTAFELWIFDLTSYALVDRIYFGNTSVGSSATSVTGAPFKMVRWGNAGLAVITSARPYDGAGGLFLIDGPAVNSSGALDATSGSAALGTYSWMSSMTPQSASTSSGGVSVTIRGHGFSPDSTACWSCSFGQFRFLPTTFINSTQLSVTIPVADLPSNQPLEISVFDPGANLFSSNALTFTIQSSNLSTQITPLNLCGISMAWDANTQLLYVGTPDYDGSYPNSVVAVDPSKGTVVKTQIVGAEPIFLSDSAGGEFLYAAYANSTNLTQLALPSMNITATGVFSNPPGTAWFPGDMKAAPNNSHTVAATLLMPGFDPQALGGVAVYDDGVQRPVGVAGWGLQPVLSLYDTLAWSASDSLLTSTSSAWDTGGSDGWLFSLSVNPSGVSYLSNGNAVVSTAGGYLHSDFGTGLIYSDGGQAADPQTGAIVGDYHASGLLVPDSSLNRVFILGQTAAQAATENFTIESFDQKTFAPVSSITLNSISGAPIALARWGSSGLAVLTIGGDPYVYENGFGMLYLISDTGFVSSAKPAVMPKSALEPVKLRWKPVPTREMLKTIHRKLRDDIENREPSRP